MPSRANLPQSKLTSPQLQALLALTVKMLAGWLVCSVMSNSLPLNRHILPDSTVHAVF